VRGISLSGAARIVARFETFGARLGARLGPVASGIGARLEGRVHDKLGGSVLHRRSGRLDAAQSMIVTARAGTISVSVGFDPRDVSYGAIQEYGGTTKAHLIAAKNARALRFSLGDQLAFAKRVNHPGSRIPARSFLRSSLVEEGDQASNDVSEAVTEELGA
jgi:phage gpG-like protein